MRDLLDPSVIGHRGMGRTVPPVGPADPETGPGSRGCGDGWQENTRASMCAAHDAGAAWVEFDVLPSADGDLVLHHDHFRAGTPVWRTPTSDLVASGAELVDGLHDDLPADLGLYLEVKAVPGDADPRLGPELMRPVLDWVDAHRDLRDVVVASFDPYVILQARDIGVRTAWITTAKFPLFSATTAAASQRLDAVVVHQSTWGRPEHELEVGVDVATEAGVALWSWNVKPQQVLGLLNAGVTGFCVDDVPGAVEALTAARTQAPSSMLEPLEHIEPAA